MQRQTDTVEVLAVCGFPGYGVGEQAPAWMERWMDDGGWAEEEGEEEEGKTNFLH